MNRKTVIWRSLFSLALAFLLLMPTGSAAAEPVVPPFDAVEPVVPPFDAAEPVVPPFDAVEPAVPSFDAAAFDVPVDAVHVSTAEGLRSAMTANVAYIAVDADLELASWYAVPEFSGVLDGQGHTLTISGSLSVSGEWGFVAINRGTIRNTHFNVEVDPLKTSSELYAGIIAETNKGVIERCGTTGSLRFFCTTTRYYLAGFVNSNDGGVIRDCYSSMGFFVAYGSGTHEQGGSTFGFMASNSGTVERCWSTAAKGPSKNGAYFCASNSGTITDCFTRYDRGESWISPVGDAITERATYPTWNFGTVWYINPAINNGCPVLRVDQRWASWLDDPKICALALDKSAVTMGTGEICQLTATMTPGPLDVRDPTLEWFSSNDAVVAVTQDGLVHGVAADMGPADITVRSKADPAVSASCTFEIERSADALQLEDLTLERGATGTPGLTIYPENADQKITWSLEQENGVIAAIDPNTGAITALDADGTATVCATAVRGGKRAWAKLTVRSSVTALDLLDSTSGTQLNGGALTFYRWQNRTVTPILTPTTATVREVRWSSSEEAIVKVDEKGTLTGVGAGDAVITATADNGAVVESFTVTVLMPGDLTGDCLADDQDAQMALDAASGLLTLTPLQTDQGDVTGDGVVNEDDAVMIYQYAKGKIPSLTKP